MIKRICIICNKNFEVDSWEFKNRASKYCSRECMGKGRKTGEYRNCKYCKNQFYIIPAHIKRRSTNGQYCSRACIYKSPLWRAKISGENQGNWKGGVTPKNHLLRDKFRKSMQKAIFERDNYTCQLCGKVGGYLQVDHIQAWAEYIELRFNIDNCRTLCMSCHYEITFNKKMPKSVSRWGHKRKYK